MGEVKEGERKKKRGWTEGSPKERQRNAGSTAILSLPYRGASSPWHNLGPPASAACVNLNRERLRGDSPRRAAILYQNVDKGSQWSTPAPACTSLAIYDPSPNRRPPALCFFPRCFENFSFRIRFKFVTIILSYGFNVFTADEFSTSCTTY